MNNLHNQDYKKWIGELKQKVYSTQIKASIAVNKTLIEFYFFIGKSISEKENIWGSKLLKQTSRDLITEFPDMKGFSVTNLKYCKNFYLFYSKPISQQLVDQIKISEFQEGEPKLEISQKVVDQFVQQLVTQIPWGHNILIFTKSKDINEALFYIKKTIENNWGRETLALQIKSDLYNRSGKALTNFKNTLPEPLSDLAQQTLKDPYDFDFMSMREVYVERDIENQLVNHITKFLLELGKGFAFIGQQYHL